MPTYTARMKYVDVREIEIEADNLEDAAAKYEAGDFEESTVDFYADEQLRPLAIKQTS